MKIDAKEGDKITIMRKKSNRFNAVEPHPILVRVEKVGRTYITGVCNWFDPQEGKIVEHNRYSSRFNMEEYNIISKSFDVDLVKRFREYQRELRRFKEREERALRCIDQEERTKYYNAKAERETAWRAANPRPTFKEASHEHMGT